MNHYQGAKKLASIWNKVLLSKNKNMSQNIDICPEMAYYNNDK